MHIGELVGYLASALVFATFYMKTMIPLRGVAIASNVAFISYGYLGGMAPILILHVALLPLNLWRLHQTQQLVKRVRLATEGDLNFDWLMPHMTARNFAAGETIFRKGDSARELFLITAGTVRLTELGVEVGRGSMVGEIGVFSPYKARIATAVAVTHVEVLAIADDRVIALYNDHREFGFYMVSLITKRLVADFEELERRVAATRPAPPRSTQA
jgi:CRP/FNR family transcriptional regulator, cyclic AMP receptor protein